MNTTTRQTMFSAKSDLWGTPQDFFDKLDSLYGFTLDPCCTTDSKKCDKHYTQADDGLSKSWKDETVFVNPPYSDIVSWADKSRREAFENNAKVVMLIPSRTDTKYWHNHIMKASEIFFVKGRLKFVDPTVSTSNSAPFPSAVVVFERGMASRASGPRISTMEKDGLGKK